MRDIVNSNGFSASNQQTKSKVTNSSGTLTKTDYRSYRDFLGSYGDCKNSKDDQESVSSNESGISSCSLSESKSNNTSTSSLNSETNGNTFKNLPKTEQGVASRTGSFRNYLESYNCKKFSSVKPVASKQNTVKSEIVIQVNDPLDQQQNEPVFVTTINGDFVGDDSIDSLPPPPKSLPPKMPNGYHKGYSYLPPPPKDEHQEDSVFPPPPPPIISTNFAECASPPPPPPPPIISTNFGGCAPPPPISNNFGGCAPPPPPPPPQLPNFAKSEGKKWNTIEVDGHSPKPKANQSEKLPSNHAAATNLAKILTQHLLPRKMELEKQLNEISNKPISPPSGVQKIQATKCLSPPPLPTLPQQNGQNNSTPENYTCSITYNTTPVPSQFSLPPPVPTVPPPRFDYCTLPRKPQNIPPKLPRSPPPKVEFPKQRMELIPPKLPQSLPPKSSGSVDFNLTTVVPINDASTKVSKNDPNVRKLVYNTYRGLLGAYNNKANDMIATLPRSRVREDQGVSKQLESMALQGGLEKLNGRTNPNVEQDEVYSNQ